MQWNENVFPDVPTRTGRGRETIDAVSTALYLGLSIPDGGTVDEYALSAFLENVVLARFPNGYNVARSEGVWKGGREGTVVLTIVYPRIDAIDNGVKLEEIRKAYRERFRQDSVLRVDTLASLSFE
jgi:hypothetical protein